MARKTDDKRNKIASQILQYFITLICLVVALFLTGKGLTYVLRTAPIFKVREVVSHDSLRFIRSRTLDRLIGQSIFDVNLHLVQKRLQDEYPQIGHLRLYRQFPSRIYVDAVRRDPFAVVSTRRQQILIDKNGVALALTPSVNNNLPVISGISLDQAAVNGKLLKHPDVELAINIIQSVRNNPHLESMPVVTLDMTNLSQIQCTLINQLKVIMSVENIQQKITMLGIFIKQSGIKPEDINYVDLRFKEPIISKKETGPEKRGKTP